MIQGVALGVFAAMSLDGHLAEPNDGLDFLASVQREDEDYGYMAFASRVVGYVVGRRTYDVVRNCVEDVSPRGSSGPFTW